MESALSGLLVRLLGPVEISAGGAPAEISQQGLRALLALLALKPNRIVPVRALIDGLWQEEPSRARELNVHARVFQLRKRLAALEPDRAESRIVTHDRGYLLALGPDELDLSQFASLAGRGRAAAAAGSWAAAAQLTRQSLRLWRGPALSDVVGASDRLAAEAGALEEKRLDVYSGYAEAMLAAGWHNELIGELAVVVSEYPWQERLRQRLMLAYYRSGRQADALACYDEGCAVLGRDLGVQPGQELQHLHRAILRADPALAPPAPTRASGQRGSAHGEPAAIRPPVVPRQLPAGSRHFAGRATELAQLDAVLDQVRPAGAVVITAIGGTGGVGKTALALHWAHRVADQFPDGQLHVNLRGYDPAAAPVTSAAAIRGFLDALGVPPSQIPAAADAQAALYRSVLDDRRMLILLDNASDPAQVRPLLPAAPGCLVLVTSRSGLAGLTTADGAIPLPLGLVSQAEATDLLAARLGPARVTAEPAAVARLIELCARLPLALAIAGARAAARPAMPLAALTAEMEDSAGRLDALDSGDPATSVRAVFSWSLRQLSDGAARLFRLLGLHPGADITAAAAASMAGLPSAHARRLIDELVNASLLAEHKPGRYAFHDLLRAYAAEQAAGRESEADRQRAIIRMLDHYLHTAGPAGSLLFGSHDLPQPALAPLAGTAVSPERLASRQEAITWFSAELPVLSAATALAESCGLDEYAWQLPCTMTEYFRVIAAGREWARLNQTALRAARRLGDPAATGRACFSIGSYYRISGAFADALANLALAMEQFLAAGDLLAQASTHMGIAKVHFSMRTARALPEISGDGAAAIFHASRALALYRHLGDATGEGRALVELADHCHVQGEPVVAQKHCAQAIELFLALGEQANLLMATETLGRIHFSLGAYQQAISCYRQVLRGNAESGIKVRPPHLLEDLGDAYLAAGNRDAAAAVWREVVDFGRAQERQNEIPTWRRDRVLAKLEQLEQTTAADAAVLAGSA